MKRVTLIFTMIALLVVCGSVYAKDYEMSKKAGDLAVLVKIDKNPPVTGINKMTVMIQDAKGSVVKDATIAIDYGMPAMPGMGAMNYKTGAVLKGESYATTINFSIGGPWFINIKINRGGQTQTVKLNVDIK